jgi:hypothetical protein
MSDYGDFSEDKTCCAECDKGETCKSRLACTGDCETSPICAYLDGGSLIITAKRKTKQEG